MPGSCSPRLLLRAVGCGRVTVRRAQKPFKRFAPGLAPAACSSPSPHSPYLAARGAAAPSSSRSPHTPRTPWGHPAHIPHPPSTPSPQTQAQQGRSPQGLLEPSCPLCPLLLGWRDGATIPPEPAPHSAPHFVPCGARSLSRTPRGGSSGVPIPMSPCPLSPHVPTSPLLCPEPPRSRSPNPSPRWGGSPQPRAGRCPAPPAPLRAPGLPPAPLPAGVPLPQRPYLPRAAGKGPLLGLGGRYRGRSGPVPGGGAVPVPVPQG